MAKLSKLDGNSSLDENQLLEKDLLSKLHVDSRASIDLLKDELANILNSDNIGAGSVNLEKRFNALNPKVDKIANNGEIDNQLAYYRLVGFRRALQEKVYDLKKGLIYENSMDVSALDKIYIDLKNDPDIVLTDEIIALYDVLKKEHEKAIIRFKINQAKKSDIISDNSMKDIFTSIENARQKGIDISELEEMIFE